jgi:tetratricopeptide (TPR) repeat protein
VNRLLAHYFLQQSDYSEAARYFALLERPQPDDSSAHFEARRNLGMHYYREGEYPNAAKEFEIACQLLETQVQRQVPEVYLYLGNSYYRLAETDRAKKVYQDLSNSGLTATQRKKCRDLFLYRGQIYLEQKRQDLAYRDFAEFLQLGGELSRELKDAYGRLVATYASFVPLDSIEHWNYVSTTMDYNYTLSVSKKETGAYRVLRREGGSKVTEETWWRQGIHLTKEVGDSVFKLPVNLQPTETKIPVIEYTSRGLECISEIVEIDQTVEIPGRGTFAHCIKVRNRQKSQTSGGTVRTTTHVFYFAPEVGEIKQEIYRDDVKVSEIVLSEYSRRDALLGN